MSDDAGHRPRNLLVVSREMADADTVRRVLARSREGSFSVEWLGRCADAAARLQRVVAEPLAGLIVDLSLPDCRGIDAFDRLYRAAPQVPMLVRCAQQDEDLGRQCVQHGAQDYLLTEHLDDRILAKALSTMILRSACADARALVADRALVTLDSIGDAVVSIDLAGVVTYLNPVAAGMTGWSLQEATGQPLGAVLRIIDGESRLPAVNPLTMAMIQNRSVGLSPNSVLVRRDGHESAIEDTAAPIHDPNGQVAGAVIVFHDVTVARTMSRQMSHLAHHDFLTGLPNRMLLNDRLSGAIALAQRNHKSLAVLFLDVDRFKQVNDTLGHAMGDRLLQSVAQRLVACVRASDTVSRQGGDEFVLLLPEVMQPHDAALCAEKIRHAMSEPHHIDGHEMSVTVSVGIGVYPKDGRDAATLMESADHALNHAKSLGRSNHQFFAPGMGTREIARTS
jgi:diguanylate cyclase (GGDEF)-like protein/PAS domain S-box-containing protein